MKGICTALLLCLLPLIANAALDLQDESDRANYSVGYQVGGDFKRQGWPVKPEAMLQGIRDAAEGKDPQLTQEQMNGVLGGLKRRLNAENRAKLAGNDGEFLKQNSQAPGVIVLPSGIQYKVLKDGTGRKPTLADTVEVVFTVSRPEGTKVGGNQAGSKPRLFPMGKAIPGLQEALRLMGEGARWQIVLPPGPALGTSDPIDNAGVLIYDLELLKVHPG